MDFYYESDGTDMKLENIICIYSGGPSKRAIRHSMIKKKNEMILGPGSVIGKKEIIEILKELHSGKEKTKGQIIEIMPENILHNSEEFLIWYSKSKVQPIYFEINDEMKKLSGSRVMMPTLVFKMTKNGGMSVMATKTNTRPTKKTVLYNSPFYNISINGLVCQGYRHKKKLSFKNIEEYERSFFTTAYTHPASSLKNPIKYKEGFEAFWKKYIKENPKKFPVEVLRRSKITMGDFING